MEMLLAAGAVSYLSFLNAEKIDVFTLQTRA
jgi:hypothetical protein